MGDPHDASGEAGNGRDPIDPERILRNIERIRKLPSALAVVAAAVGVYWLIWR